MPEKTEHPIQAADGANSRITAFHSPTLDDTAPVVLLKPAMGVRASFYEPLAEPLSAVGLRLVTADLRGHGHSDQRANRRCDFGFREMLEYDWPAEIQCVRETWPGATVVLLGHSLGGKLSLLHTAANPGSVDGVITCASCSVYWRRFPAGLGILAMTQLTTAIAALVGHYPGEVLGFAGREARTVMSDWAYQSRTGSYRATGSSVDYDAHLQSIQTPALVLSIQGDHYAPQAAADHLASKLDPAWTTRQHLGEPAIPKVHFRWVRNADPIVTEIRNWMGEKSLIRGSDL